MRSHNSSKVNRIPHSEIIREADHLRGLFKLGQGYIDVVDLLESKLGNLGVVYKYLPEEDMGGESCLYR